MRRPNYLFTLITAFLVTANVAQAELWLIGTAEYDDGGGVENYNLVYDTEQQLTFLDYVGGYDTWANKKDWAESLSLAINLLPGFSAGEDLSTGWRLPEVDNPTDTNLSRFGWNQDPVTLEYLGHDDSEMARLYYAALGNEPNSAYSSNNYAPFENIPDDIYSYWTGSITGEATSDFRWDFKLANGEQFAGDSTSQSLLAIAVHTGAVNRSEVSNAVPYILEDFDTKPALDAAWGNVAGVDSEAYIENGELNHVIRPYSETAKEEPLNIRHRFANSTNTGLTQFQTNVRLEYVADIGQVSELEYAAVEFSGFFYNTGTAPVDATGDVMFLIRFGDRGNGLESWWELLEFTDGDYIGYIKHASGTLPEPTGGWQTGQNYILGMTYDGAGNFTASLGGISTGLVTAPVPQAEPFYNGKWIRSRIFMVTPFTGDPEAARLHAVYDDVYVGINTGSLALYDSFDDSLSITKWNQNELLRESKRENSMLKMRYKTASTDTLSSAIVRLRADLPQVFTMAQYFKMDMQIVGNVTPEGTRGEIRFGGNWGNGKYTEENFPGGEDGNISFEANLRRNPNTPYIYDIACYLSMCNDTNCSERLDYNLTSNIQVQPDTMYTVAMRRDDTVFSCDVTNTVTSGVILSESVDLSNHGVSTVSPINEFKRFWAAVRQNPGEVLGYIDNIEIEALPGDINFDTEVNLEDVVLGLQLLTGQPVADITTAADVDLDGVLGMPEIIYGLKQVAE